jgi:gliding motility-associated-like protein
VPADITIECDQDANDLSLTGDVTDAADNCDTNLNATFTDVVTASDCANASSIARTWNLTDACGNTTELVQTISVVDTTAPTFTVPADITLECNQDANDLSLTGDVTDEADNCDSNLDASFVDVVTAGDCASTSTIARTWSVTDACGNTTELVQTISIIDETAPTFTVPAAITLECDQDINDLNLTGDVTDEADNCDSNLDATYTDTIADGDCANAFNITRTWTLSDACGNTTNLTQTITVVDTTAPTFTVPADITLECEEDSNDLNLTGDVTDEADNCDTNLEVTFTDVITTGGCASESIISRTWTLSDACGNTTEFTQTITLIDNTAPIFDQDMPADVTVECDSVPAVADITATDACGAATVTFEETSTAGECPEDAIITRTWTATDDCGNEVTHIQIITVQDTTAPNVVGEFETELTASCGAIPEVPNLSFEDACSSDMTVDFTETSTADGSNTNYEIIREWIVTDACGNEGVFTQTIFVEIDANVTGGSTELCIGEDIDFDLFNLLSGDYETGGTWEVTSGTASLNGSIFNPFELEVGSYTFTYTDTESACPSETEVTIDLNDECIVLPCGAEDVEISKAVTANGDQWNEFFTVSGIEDCGFTVEVQIFNRWGAMIFESKNYQNNWNGFAHNSSVGGSDKVPTGTYYYIVKLNNSGLKPFSGPIYVGTK